MVSSFDAVDHAWLIRFVEHRTPGLDPGADRRVIRLIRKWLKAGVMEDGQVTPTGTGTPQGAVISPLLANIYLHYVFDLWGQHWRKRHARGHVILVRYADDIVAGFEHKADAERFRADLNERMARFALTLHQEKTRLIEFGRFAAGNRERRGLGKASTSSAGDVQLPGLHAYLRAHPARRLPASAAVATRPDARQAA